MCWNSVLSGLAYLADLIDFVDENLLGCDGYKEKCLHVGLATKIRRTSSIELADLAAIITPQVFGTMASKQLPNFHVTVSESPVLTEPWTILLIRAFTKASVFHMSEIEELLDHQWLDMDHYRDELLALCGLKAALGRSDSCAASRGWLKLLQWFYPDI